MHIGERPFFVIPFFSNKAVQDGKALEYLTKYIIKYPVKQLSEGQSNVTRVLHMQN